MKRKNDNIKKNFLWNTIGTSLNAFNSLFYMIIVTRINGVNDAGIFTFAFSTACLFYVIGIYSGRSYQVTENDKKISDSDYFYTKIITCMIMILISILNCFINQYSIYKISVIMFLVLYKSIEAFSEFTYAVIQKNDELYKVGKSMFYKSLFSLLLFLLLDILTKNILVSEISIIVVNIIIVLLYDFPNLKQTKFQLKEINRNGIINLLKKGFCAFMFTFLTLYVINASKYAIDGNLEDKFQTVFGIILMPATILSLFAQFIIQPFVLKMKNLLNSNYIDFLILIIKISVFIFIIGILIIMIAYPFGTPILSLLYGINLKEYTIDLIVILIGAIFYSLTMVFSTALTTMRYTFNQMIIFAITSIITMFLSNYLVINSKIYGASIAYMISMFILLVLYIIIFIISYKKYFIENKKETLIDDYRR